jgi:RNase P subunit RPR2
MSPTRPRFCTRCGKLLEGNNATVELIDNNGKTVWDTYCENCDWSGYISPDVEEEDVKQ